jgi:hypothetical protein
MRIDDLRLLRVEQHRRRVPHRQAVADRHGRVSRRGLCMRDRRHTERFARPIATAVSVFTKTHVPYVAVAD